MYVRIGYNNDPYISEATRRNWNKLHPDKNVKLVLSLIHI